jgi:hypothetical protein
MNSHYITRRRFATLCLVTIILLLSLSCSNQNGASDSGYKTFAFQKDDIRFKQDGIYSRGEILFDQPLFTFEYPGSFEVANETKPRKDTNVVIIRQREPVPGAKYMDESVINVHIFKPGSFYPGVIDSETRIDSILKDLAKNPNIDNYKIIERKSITVSGIPAEYFSYTIDSSFNGKRMESSDRSIVWMIFNYKDFVWEISLASPPDQIQENGTYFAHLIETFRFLPPYPDGLKQ